MRWPYGFLVLVASMFSWLPQESATAQQFVQQGHELVGSDTITGYIGGGSVSLSSDGNTAMIGWPADNGGAGAVWVFTRSGSVWSQQGNKLVGTGAVGSAWQGYSVSLSADGNTAIVGGSYDNNATGAGWVYTRIGGVWSQQGAKLVGTDALGSSRQGSSVSLSADGNTALVGGYKDNANQGAAWVFTRSGGIWSQQAKLVGTGVVGYAEQGFSVSLSADGNTALVGGFHDGLNAAGAAWVFIRSGSTWSQQGNKLVGSGATGSASQGWSVSLSADGNTAIVGGPNDGTSKGASWVFTRSGSVWSQQGAKLVGTGAVGNAGQGSSVSLSSDGSTAIVGGETDSSGVGAAWMFRQNGGVWSQQGAKLVGTGGKTHLEGTSVSLSSDGTTAIVGGEGTAWVFTHTATAVREQPLAIPRQFGLDQNYPNPFNPTTTIRYQLPTSSAVRLSVYDIVGREVSVLADETKPAGSYEVKFDGTRHASGAYFCRLIADGIILTRPMLLAK